jgi:hypothetical protein
MTAPKRCTPAIRAGRLVKAQQFHQAADLLSAAADDSEVVDACVMLSVHAGIAAADVICCAKLGEHHRGDDHHGAVALLGKADKAAAKNLKVLLDLKSRSGYGAALTSTTDRKRAGRAAAALVRSAETV